MHTAFMMKKSAHHRVVLNKRRHSSIYFLGVFFDRERIYLYFRLKDDPPDIFHVAISTDGFSFEKYANDLWIAKWKTQREEADKCTSFFITQFGKQYLLTYLRQSGNKKVLEKAWSEDLFHWSYEGDIVSLNKSGVIVADYLFQGQYVMYAGDSSLKLYFSKDLIHWEESQKDIFNLRANSSNSANFAVEYAFKTEKGVLLFYHLQIDNVYFAGFVLLDPNNPVRILWQSNEPIWVQPKEWKKKEVVFVGVAEIRGMIISYWQVDGKELFASVYVLYKISDGQSSKDISLRLQRSEANPIISPRNHNAWEAFNTFNPAAIYAGGKVHILYRAQGYDFVSVLGYASSRDGIHIDERLNEPVYAPTQSFENMDHKSPSKISYSYVSGGGYGGCEDPRISKIDNRYYLTYVAFNGVNPPRVALTSISSDNFLARRWLWEKPVLISPPGIVDKSAVIFPEKINGKYCIMHRIYPDILIDFTDDLNFDGTNWLKGEYKISPRLSSWDSRKIGAGAPPIKTKYGWLLIYQSVGERDSGRYKIGAMLLDLNDPTKVLCRSKSPILEPEAPYENDGFKAGVIYPCGAVVIDNTVYIYYGGADSYVCVATANLEEFLKELMFSDMARLTIPILEKIF